MPFVPHTPTDIDEMLKVIGVSSVDELFDEIPAALRVPGLPGIPAGLNEMQIGRLMSERALICCAATFSARPTTPMPRRPAAVSLKILRRT